MRRSEVKDKMTRQSLSCALFICPPCFIGDILQQSSETKKLNYFTALGLLPDCDRRRDRFLHACDLASESGVLFAALAQIIQGAKRPLHVSVEQPTERRAVNGGDRAGDACECGRSRA